MSFGVSGYGQRPEHRQTCALSLLVFTGASQFTAVSIHASGGSSASALASALLLAARNGVYGLAMSRRLRGGGLGRRLLAAHLTLDESTAMAAAQPNDRDAEKAFWITGVAVFVFWNIGTLAGALVGDHIGDPARYGLDAAFPVGFVACCRPSCGHNWWVAALGGAEIAWCHSVTPVGVPVLAAGVAALAGPTSPRADDWVFILRCWWPEPTAQGARSVVLSGGLGGAARTLFRVAAAAIAARLDRRGTFSTGRQMTIEARAAGRGGRARVTEARPLSCVIVLGSASPPSSAPCPTPGSPFNPLQSATSGGISVQTKVRATGVRSCRRGRFEVLVSLGIQKLRNLWSATRRSEVGVLGAPSTLRFGGGRPLVAASTRRFRSADCVPHALSTRGAPEPRSGSRDPRAGEQRGTRPRFRRARTAVPVTSRRGVPPSSWAEPLVISMRSVMSGWGRSW